MERLQGVLAPVCEHNDAGGSTRDVRRRSQLTLERMKQFRAALVVDIHHLEFQYSISGSGLGLGLGLLQCPHNHLEFQSQYWHKKQCRDTGCDVPPSLGLENMMPPSGELGGHETPPPPNHGTYTGQPAVSVLGFVATVQIKYKTASQNCQHEAVQTSPLGFENMTPPPS